MLNYVVAFIDKDNNYSIQYTCAESKLTALRKIVPQFSQLCTRYQFVEEHVSEYLTPYIHEIGINCLTITQLPQLTDNIRMQILSIYNPTDCSLTVTWDKATSNIDSLYNLAYQYLEYEDDEIVSHYTNRDIKGIILRLASLTGLRVYTVSTLRNLIKSTLDNK